MNEPTLPTRSEGAPEAAPLLRLALEIGPLLVFFAVNARAGIYWATSVFMVAIVASLALSRVLEKRFPVMPLVTAAFVLVFGGLTLILRDEVFIKLKPTLVNALFGAILLVGLACGRALLKPVFGTAFSLDEAGWRKLSLRWALFFLVLAAANEFVRHNVSTDGWVKFKVFGIMPLTFVFALLQTPLIKRHGTAP